MDKNERVELPDPASDPAMYCAALMAVVQNRDPLEIIVQTPAQLRELIRGQSDEMLGRRPAPAEWSAIEIAGHLLDDEIVNAFRLRLTLTENQPSYPGNDPEGWARLPKPPLAALLQTWEALRTYNLWLLESLPRSEWTRVGLHQEQGPESVEMLILKNAGHDLAHLDQLARCLSGPSDTRSAVGE